jgi:hypothetical protein
MPVHSTIEVARKRPRALTMHHHALRLGPLLPDRHAADIVAYRVVAALDLIGGLLGLGGVPGHPRSGTRGYWAGWAGSGW